MTGLSEFNAWLTNDGSENITAISGHAKGKFDKWKEVVEKVSELLQQETDEAKERPLANADLIKEVQALEQLNYGDCSKMAVLEILSKYIHPAPAVQGHGEGLREIELRSMLEDVVNELNLSESAIEKHGPLGTAPAVLVREVLAEKDLKIRALKQGMVDTGDKQEAK